MKVQSVSNEIVEMCAEGAFNVVEEMTSEGQGGMPWEDLRTADKQRFRDLTRRVLTEGITAKGFDELMGLAVKGAVPPPPPRSADDPEDAEEPVGPADSTSTFYAPNPKSVVFVATVKVCYFCATGSRG